MGRGRIRRAGHRRSQGPRLRPLWRGRRHQAERQRTSGRHRPADRDRRTGRGGAGGPADLHHGQGRRRHPRGQGHDAGAQRRRRHPLSRSGARSVRRLGRRRHLPRGPWAGAGRRRDAGAGGAVRHPRVGRSGGQERHRRRHARRTDRGRDEPARGSRPVQGHSAGRTGRSGRGVEASGPEGRLHQRLLRHPAPRPRRLSEPGARLVRPAGRGAEH